MSDTWTHVGRLRGPAGPPGEQGPPGPPGADAPQWVALTQAAFDQLNPPDPNTLYIIVP